MVVSQASAQDRYGLIKRIRWDALAFIVIIVAGFVLAFTAYQHGLPFIDYPDEMTMWTRGRATIDPTWTMFQPEYPPGMVWLSALVQQVQHDQGEVYINPAGATRVGRLTSVVAFTLTLALILLLTRELLTEKVSPMLRLLGSLIAGLLWMWLPLAVLHARYAMPDCWLCMGFVASLYAAVRAWKRQSERWLWLSLIFGIVATLFKWQAAIIFLATGVACLRFWPQRRQFLCLIVTFGVIVGAFSLWVIFVRHALEGGLYMPGTKPAFPTPFTVFDNIIYQSTTIAPVFLFGVLPAITLIFLFSKATRQYVQIVPVLMLPMLVLALDTILSINGSRLFPRHYLPALALLAILAGVGVALVLQFVWQMRLVGNTVILKAATTIVMLILVATPLIGMAQETLKMTREQLRPDRRVMLMDWIATNALDHPLMITNVNLAAAVDPLYGYHGPKVTTPESGAYIKSDNVTDDQLQSHHIQYLVAQPSTIFPQLHNPFLPLIPLLTVGDDPALRGETWTVYYVGAVPGLQSSEHISFGDTIQLRGFALDQTEVCAGQSISLHLAWGAIKTPQRYYVFFLHLANSEQGELSTPINGQQPVGDNRPTITWTRPDELLIAPTVTAAIDATVKPGIYDLWLGLFEPEGTDRLYLPDGKHYAIVGKLKVKTCP
jgi:4-amino-4-deoxy-L-arabinose transferase-like glycosyltransferase